MEFRILGPLEVVRGSRSVEIAGSRPKSILAVLLIDIGRVVSTDQLIDALWGDRAPETASNAIQVYISSIRKALRSEAGAVVTRKPGYVLTTPPDQVDARRFERLVADGSQALRAGKVDSAAETLREALSLWRGPALADFAYDDFARAETNRLDELRLVAVEDRIEADLGLGRHADLIGELDALISEWPLRERLRGHRMIALYRSGRQAEALETYQEARNVLADGLGIDPSPALQRLEAAILAQEESLEGSAPGRPSLVAAPNERRRHIVSGPMPSASLPHTAEALHALVAREERKVVSVLFCDLVGFTEDSEDADPEEVRARVRPYHEMLRAEIERFGGTVEKFIGDAVMAVFGAPVAHEDDPERAVRAGLRITEAIEELNERRPELDLQVRVGVETGTAVVSLDTRPELGEPMVVGDVVNTASRLQGAAPVGGVGVGRATYLATKGVFEYDDIGPVKLKGKAKPVAMFHARVVRSRLEAPSGARAAMFVGREAEQGVLRAVFSRSVRDSSVQLVTISGEPGIGKSRLVAELRSRLADDPELTVRWRRGRCLAYGDGITFWALGEVVKAEAGIYETDDSETVRVKLDGALPPDDPDREWLRQRLLPLVGIEAESPADREESFAAWRRFLEGVAASGPSVVVLEDLHWADDAMLDFLDHVVEYADAVPLTVIATARPELFVRHPAFAARVRNATRVDLAPLTPTETGALVADLLHQALLPAEIQAIIVERAGGNPLYTEEYIRLLTERGILRWEGSTWHLDEHPDVPPPTGISALIAARLDMLSPGRKAVLSDAAVVGETFWLGAISSMSGGDREQIERDLHELGRIELVRRARYSSMGGETEYRFWHALVRDVAYAQIPRRARAERHVAAAAWIESAAADRLEDVSEILASHYSDASDLFEATGDHELAKNAVEPALRYLLLAGERVMGLNVATAGQYLGRAVELAPPGHPLRAQVLSVWGDALRRSGRLAEAVGAYEEAVAGFRQLGNVTAAARAMMKLSGALSYSDDPRYPELAAEAITMLESQSPGQDLVDVYEAMAGSAGAGGRPSETLRWADRAVRLAEDLGLEEPHQAAIFSSAAHEELGDGGGLDNLRRELALALEQSRGRDAAIAYTFVSSIAYFREGPAAALDVAKQGISFAERRGMFDVALWERASSLPVMFSGGEWDEALASAAALLGSVDLSDSNLRVQICNTQARILLLRGHLDAALGAIDWALPAASQSDLATGPLLMAAAAHVARGDGSTALELLAELERVPLVRETYIYRTHLPLAVRTAIAAGDVDFAARLATEIDAHWPLMEYALAASMAAIAEARGQLDEAALGYEGVAASWRAFGFVPELAYALLGEGRAHLGLGRRGDAGPLLEEAREIFGALEVMTSLEECDRLLAEALEMSS